MTFRNTGNLKNAIAAITTRAVQSIELPPVRSPEHKSVELPEGYIAGASGLGLDAQRQAVAHQVNGNGQLVAEYTEIESGHRHTNRPQLRPRVTDRSDDQLSFFSQ